MRKKNGILALIILLCACARAPLGINDANLAPVEISDQFPAGQLKAGVASVDVSPSRPQYLAGFGNNRKSTGINDPIFARAVVFEQGGQRLALVSIDAIGIQRHHLPQYFDKIKEVPADRVIIACTHDHSAPDTMGLWGKVYAVSDGRDLEWIEYLASKVGEAVDQAAKSAEPVELVFGKGQVAERGVVRNVREPQWLDREVGVIGIFPLASKTPKAVLVNFQMHGETLWGENTIITPDWPGFMRKRLEEMSGAQTAILFNGAFGAMVTVDNLIDRNGNEAHTFAEADRVGTAIAETANSALNSGERIKNPGLFFARKIFYLPSDNPLFNFFSNTPLITRTFYRGHLQTEVNYIRIGPLEMLTFPGEAYPKIGLNVKQNMTGKYHWLIGLADDELGYLIYPWDYYNRIYSYEISASMSPRWGGLLVEKQALDLANKYSK